MKSIRSARVLSLTGMTTCLLSACVASPAVVHRVPAVEYANRVKWEYARNNPDYRRALIEKEGFISDPVPAVLPAAAGAEGRARLTLASDEIPPDLQPGNRALGDTAASVTDSSVVTNMGTGEAGYQVQPSTHPNLRDYTSPLPLGEPGQSASLWRESSNGLQLFRDYRAWQPMDLITILVTENSQAKSKSDTNVKQESTIEAALEYFFGVETWLADNQPDMRNKDGSLKPMVGASSKHDYKGESETKREGNLRGTISAMVAEVLPSGVLRIEGEKIVTVNNEDEIMKISGLVRPEDINSANEVDSSKVANVRIDYYGKGTVGDADKGGWIGRLLRQFWPF